MGYSRFKTCILQEIRLTFILDIINVQVLFHQIFMKFGLLKFFDASNISQEKFLK